MPPPDPVIVKAAAPDDYLRLARLIGEYRDELGLDLTFQNIEAELARLAQEYGPPRGRALLALVDGAVAGGVALRGLAPEISEMKRLYVRPAFRGRGLGRLLARAIIDEARKLGYRSLRLDSLSSMVAAVKMYESLGFKRIAPYRDNPLPDPVFLEIAL